MKAKSVKGKGTAVAVVERCKGEIVNTELDGEISRFRKLFVNGLKMIEDAAKQYAESLAKHPADADIAYMKAFPHLMDRDWKMLAKIGEGRLVAKAFLIPNDYAVKCIEVFPAHVQRSLLGDAETGAVPQKVLSRGRIVEKKVEDMTFSELNSIFDKKRRAIRTPEEQMKIATKEAEAVAAAFEAQSNWEIRSGKLCVFGRANFTIDDVVAILKKMQKAR